MTLQPVRQLDGYLLNWTPDLPDIRDHLLSFEAPRTLPSQVDLRPLMPPIVDQGQIGSCTANALAGALGFLQEQDLKKKGKQAHEYNSKRFIPNSRLFIYYNSRLLIGMQNQDSGAYLRDGIKTLNQQGVCQEDKWKYDPKLLYKLPKKSSYDEAAKYKISQYMRIMTLDQMRSSLADSFPIVFGFSVYESFYNTGKTGVTVLPGPGEKLIGGHAVCAVGYDDDMRQFICRNSWGNRWGFDGYFKMPYEYVYNSQLSSDYWTIRV